MHALQTYDLMVLALGAIAFGFYLLMKGGDWAIDAAVYLAEQAGLSKMFVGATILAFGTSVPELFASVNANLAGFPGISIGNVIGSNIANILLVLGATAIVYPVMCRPAELKYDVIMMLVATAALTIAMQFETISRLTGLILFGVLAGFVLFQYKNGGAVLAANLEDVPQPTADAQDSGSAAAEEGGISSKASALGFLFGGFAALAVGSELLVKGAVTIGMALEVPEAIIGMTVVAFGTSLPELSTCIAAAAKKHTEMLIGNIVGSNVFNILSIVGITALIKPIAVDANLLGLSLWSMVGVAVLISGWLLAGKRLDRAHGIVLTVGYGVFITLQYIM